MVPVVQIHGSVSKRYGSGSKANGSNIDLNNNVFKVRKK